MLRKISFISMVAVFLCTAVSSADAGFRHRRACRSGACRPQRSCPQGSCSVQQLTPSCSNGSCEMIPRPAEVLPFPQG